jgi:hemerythrin superfamily protein
VDAIELLKDDHDRIKGLFLGIEKVDDPRGREMLLTQLLNELTIHERIEEEIFYPAVDERAKEKELEDLVIESYVEHDFVNKIAKDILATDLNAEAWPAKLKVMKENVEHHAFEEEEGKLFPKVRELFSKDELEELGSEMAELKEETSEEIEETEETSSA